MNMISKHYSTKLSMLALFCLIVLGACKKSPDDVPEVTGDAWMKYVNAQADAQPQEAFIDDTKVSIAPVAYNNSSEYLKVRAGTRTLAFRDQGATTATASSQLNIPADAYFTSYYVKDAQGGKVLALLDDLTPPAPSTQARIRFLNLGSSFTNGLNFTEVAGNNEFITGLAFGNVSRYYTIAPGLAFKVTAAGSVTAVDIPGTTFAAGKIYTVWVNANSTGSPLVHVVTHN
ncbi:hypothetical protein C7T94_17880 [Pedobacter yulinensis]|uniref:DUF4397 domain-containing protein n=1 Tax=Pedobacter yulinensis TaxID=2126353 RepID=A0A2T3HH83_9SPHI|nr:DUF4397 domain-containing protein [Pedobacter yulinensis]PST81741.1 hypothetical protein C7T94_17880 [Pedobacter yulinensis]